MDIFFQTLAYYKNICWAFEQVVPIFGYGIWLLSFLLNRI